MSNLIKTRSTHSQRLDRWLGPDQTERLSRAMRGWYGPPILVGNIPSKGPIYIHRDGDFTGGIRGGFFASLADRLSRALRRTAQKNVSTMSMAGFSSMSDFIQEVTQNGKARPHILFNKVGTTGVIGGSNSLFRCTGQPSAGAAAAAAPGGTIPTSATTGVPVFVDPGGGDTLHISGGFPLATVSATHLLYDRIFSVLKTMNSTATEAVTGVPTRYTSTTPGAADSAEGNFVFPECGVVLPATAHNWTTCLYTDEAGNTGQTLPSITGFSALPVNRIDINGSWFAPLAAGDVGIKALSQMQCSAAVATGAIDFVMGHPLMWLPCPVANTMIVADGINDPYNLPRVFSGAALALLDIFKTAVTATVHSGGIQLVAG